MVLLIGVIAAAVLAPQSVLAGGSKGDLKPDLKKKKKVKF